MKIFKAIYLKELETAVIIVDHKAVVSTHGILYIGPLPYTKQRNKLNPAITLFLSGEGTTHHDCIVITHEAKRKPQNPTLANVLMGVPQTDPYIICTVTKLWVIL